MSDVVKRVESSMGHAIVGDGRAADAYAADAIDEIRAAVTILRDLGDAIPHGLVEELEAAAGEIRHEREAARDRLVRARASLWALVPR